MNENGGVLPIMPMVFNAHKLIKGICFCVSAEVAKIKIDPELNV